MSVYDFSRMEVEHLSHDYDRKVVRGEQMMAANVEVKAGAITQPHSHPGEEIVYVLKGVWHFTLPDEEVTLGENQMLVIPAGAEHSAEAIEDVKALVVCTPCRNEWLTNEDRKLHYNPEQSLWAV